MATLGTIFINHKSSSSLGGYAFPQSDADVTSEKHVAQYCCIDFRLAKLFIAPHKEGKV